MARFDLRTLFLTTASSAFLFVAGAAAAQNRPAEEDQPAPQKRDMETAIYETWKDILPKVKEEVDPGEQADKPMPEPEDLGAVEYIPPVAPDPANSTAVMNSANPILSNSCRTQVEDLHRKAYAALHEVDDAVAEAELQKHYQELRAMMMEKPEITPADVFGHIAECSEFCFPRKVFLTACHIYAVSTADRREIVFFDYDQSFVRPEFWGVIRSIAEDVTAGGDRKLLIVGRASEPGGDDYNVQLSHLRAASVIDILKEHGTREDQITYMTIGEYTPNMDRDLLERYRLSDTLTQLAAADSRDEYLKLNQSVLMVVYNSAGDDHAAEEHDHDHEHGAPAADTGIDETLPPR